MIWKSSNSSSIIGGCGCRAARAMARPLFIVNYFLHKVKIVTTLLPLLYSRLVAGLARLNKASSFYGFSQLHCKGYYWSSKVSSFLISRSHYNRPNRSLPSAWNNTFLRNRSIFSRYLRTPRCARFSCRRSHITKQLLFQFHNRYSSGTVCSFWQHHMCVIWLAKAYELKYVMV